MRIIGYIDNQSNKITVFKNGLRYVVKFEQGTLEQSFKFRSSDKLSSFQDIEKMIDEEFITQVQQQFDNMRKNYSNLIQRFWTEESQEWEEII